MSEVVPPSASTARTTRRSAATIWPCTSGSTLPSSFEPTVPATRMRSPTRIDRAKPACSSKAEPVKWRSTGTTLGRHVPGVAGAQERVQVALALARRGLLDLGLEQLLVRRLLDGTQHAERLG